MSIIVPTELEVQRDLLAMYRKAEAAILGGAQEYTVGSGSTARRIIKADLGEVRKAIEAIEGRITSLTTVARGPRRVRYLRPL